MQAQITVRADQSGDVINTATALWGGTWDGDPSNNSSTATVTVLPPVTTRTGSNVRVRPLGPTGAPLPITLTFSDVSVAGFVSAVPVQDGPNVPANFQINGTMYDITTTARSTPPVTVCFGGSFTEADLVLHFENGEWVKLPNRLLLPPAGPFTTICADTTSLSPFVVATEVNRHPTADAGATQTVEATSPVGAIVTFSGSGSDPDGGPLTFAWSGPCGTASAATATLTCPIGTSEMTLTATDISDLSATAAATIVVRDTTPPALALPPNIVSNGTTGIVIFTTTATDLVDITDPVTCTPASGSAFPLGATTVTCTSTDAHGNTSTGSFVVTRGGAPPVCSSAQARPSVLWPPNHQLVAIGIGGVTDPDGNPLTLAILGIFQDEPTNGDDDRRTTVDGAGVGTSRAWVRAERSGQGNGRVYHIRFSATDPAGLSCAGEVTVSVPLGARGGAAVDDGPRYDSTAPAPPTDEDEHHGCADARDHDRDKGKVKADHDRKYHGRLR